MTDEWGPWIEHDGKGCPCIGSMVEAEYDVLPNKIFIAGTQSVLRGTHIPTGEKYGAGRCRWDWTSGAGAKILRYRIRKPRGLIILQKIIADLPAPVRNGVDA